MLTFEVVLGFGLRLRLRSGLRLGFEPVVAYEVYEVSDEV